MKLQTEILKSDHYRDDFNCGNDILNNYLKKQANQDVKKKLSVCFVVCEIEDERNVVKGYYTLSNYGISRGLIPEKFQKKFPKSYKTIPATLLGRLARDEKYGAPRAGEFLLMDALYKTYITSQDIASFAVVVDPIDEKAKSFYSKYNFIELPDSKKMFIPMKTLSELFG
mgnify:CR=1 FL=1|tara:strand:+ start:54 stop:563 length:510 start_codon:yes stop_codon:yes gene_type:complete